MRLKQSVYAVYKKLQWFWPFATASSFIYTELLPYIKKRSGAVRSTNEHSKNRIAFICDEMTWQDFYPECDALYLTPWGWKDALCGFKPHLLFCEAAWSGISAHPDCWRGRIYKSAEVRRENRKVLFDIIKWCHNNNVPTVFWNKEDPAYFDNPSYNFVDTALRFDHIFTTAAECLPRYAQLGHTSTGLLTFGFSPRLFYPDDSIIKEETAVFAGSWYADEPDRCADAEKLFDFVLDQGLQLIIYDRKSGYTNPNNRFPARYRQYIKPAVPFTALGDIYRKNKYCININTVTSSETMFARRVYEAMACGCIIISNESKSLKKQFEGRIWFEGERFEPDKANEIIIANCRDVFENHTCNMRMGNILALI